jgi:hypothetical protein
MFAFKQADFNFNGEVFVSLFQYKRNPLVVIEPIEKYNSNVVIVEFLMIFFPIVIFYLVSVYIESIISLYFSVIIRRFTFSVGVNSPVSTEKS